MPDHTLVYTLIRNYGTFSPLWNSVFSWLTLQVYQHVVFLFYSSIIISHRSVVEMFVALLFKYWLVGLPVSLSSDVQPPSNLRHPMWKGAMSPIDLLHHPLLESPTKWHLYPWGLAYLSHRIRHFTRHPHALPLRSYLQTTGSCSAERCGEEHSKVRI